MDRATKSYINNTNNHNNKIKKRRKISRLRLQKNAFVKKWLTQPSKNQMEYKHIWCKQEQVVQVQYTDLIIIIFFTLVMNLKINGRANYEKWATRTKWLKTPVKSSVTISSIMQELAIRRRQLSREHNILNSWSKLTHHH